MNHRKRQYEDTADEYPDSKSRRVDLAETAKQQWDKLTIKLGQPAMERCQFLCHCTGTSSKEKITADSCLKAFVTTNPKSSPLAQGNTEGIWFLASKYKGKLPNMSIHGRERLKYKTSSLISEGNGAEWKLFFESTYFYKTRIQYVCVVLAKKPLNGESSPEVEAYQWCNENLHEVDLNDNPIFCYSVRDRGVKVLTMNCQGLDYYVEVLLLGDLPIDSIDCTWDTVRHYSIPCMRQPTFGIP